MSKVTKTASIKDQIIGAILGGQSTITINGLAIPLNELEEIKRDLPKIMERKASEQADYWLKVLNS